MISIRKDERACFNNDLYLPFLKIWGIDIFNQFIDFRKWYKIMTPKDKKKGEKWKDVGIWFLDYEINDMENSRKDNGRKKYSKPFIRKKISFMESSHLRYAFVEKLSFLWIALISFTLGYKLHDYL